MKKKFRKWIARAKEIMEAGDIQACISLVEELAAVGGPQSNPPPPEPLEAGAEMEVIPLIQKGSRC